MEEKIDKLIQGQIRMETKILTWTMNNSDSLSSINLPPGSVISKPSSVGGTYTVTYVLQP